MGQAITDNQKEINEIWNEMWEASKFNKANLEREQQTCKVTLENQIRKAETRIQGTTQRKCEELEKKTLELESQLKRVFAEIQKYQSEIRKVGELAEEALGVARSANGASQQVGAEVQETFGQVHQHNQHLAQQLNEMCKVVQGKVSQPQPTPTPTPQPIHLTINTHLVSPTKETQASNAEVVPTCYMEPLEGGGAWPPISCSPSQKSPPTRRPAKLDRCRVRQSTTHSKVCLWCAPIFKTTYV